MRGRCYATLRRSITASSDLYVVVIACIDFLPHDVVNYDGLYYAKKLPGNDGQLTYNFLTDLPVYNRQIAVKYRA